MAPAPNEQRPRANPHAVPLAFVGLHLLFCLVVYGSPSEGSWQWLPMLLIDFPASLLVLLLARVYGMPPLLLFGVIGSLWWYLLVRWVARWLRKDRRWDPL